MVSCLVFLSFFLSPFRIGWDCLTKLTLLTYSPYYRVHESIAAEKRLAESKYPVLSFRGGTASLDNMFARVA